MKTKPDCKCKFCGEWFNSADEGATYGDGTAAHEDCHNNAEFEAANESDFRD